MSPQAQPSVAQTAAETLGMERVWPGHIPLSHLQVSSYGGTLRYELHSESQRGDVFLPTESRPDVLLQVAAGRRGGWAGGHSRARTVGSPDRALARLPRATR